MKIQPLHRHSSGIWVPSLYFAEGLPYIIVTELSLIMYKRLGMSNEEVTLYVSWLSLPWMLKPFWSPIVQMWGEKRTWILTMQLLVGACLALVGLTLPLATTAKWSFIFLFLVAFSSASHDIAADGFYMQELNEKQQSLFVGVRNTFYRLSTLTGSGLLLILAGTLEAYLKVPIKAWAWTLFIAALFMLLLMALHAYLLPKSQRPKEELSPEEKPDGFWYTFIDFFKKPHIGIAIAFMLLYRLPEALLTKIYPLFLLDANNISKGGLGMTTSDIGFAKGMVGVTGLLLGGILGGIAIAVHGFRRWLWVMVASISFPNIVYIILAYYQPTDITFISACIFIEQFGYGFGLTAYMLYLLYFSQGKNQTAHYAFCTGFMTLGLILPGMCAGYLQEQMGYLNFFIFIVCLCPVTFLVSSLIKIDPNFGKSATKAKANSAD